MRPSTLLLALPALAAAQQQAPLLDQLKGWFAKATESISSAIPSVSPHIPTNPIAAGAKKAAAALKLKRIEVSNYQDLLKPGAATASPGYESWMIFVTGGNKTCFGLCEHAETAFNASVPLISASPTAPYLGLLNCETDGPLCHAWAVSAPSILHFLLPQPLADQSTAHSIVRDIKVNRTTVTAPEIAAIHLQEKYKETEPYEGFWHPFNGPLATSGLALPLGYAIWGLS